MDQILSLLDASKLLGVSPATMRFWKRKGRGPSYVRVGRLLRYQRADLIAWIERHRVATDAR